MLEDGAAFCEFQAWFDAQSGIGNNDRISELTISEKIEVLRSVRTHYVSPSFGTIAGFNANAALPSLFRQLKRHFLLLTEMACY